MLAGTLRQNLDPFSEHDDATLNDALRAAGLLSLQRTIDQPRIALDTAIAGGGTNLSMGQRQILALARALVRGSKLRIMDEATSQIDTSLDDQVTLYEILILRRPSDILQIQRTIREELSSAMVIHSRRNP